MAAEEFCLKNLFLLAMPNHFGGYFANSIIYMCEHNAEGGMGLVINKPLTLTLDELLGEMNLKAVDDIAKAKVLEGGPMDRQRGFILHSADVSFESSAIVADNLRLSTARDALAAIARGKGPANYLITTGYAGWGPGQLEDEMVDNAWLSCPSDLQIIFEEPYSTRVTKAANNIGINFSLMSARAGYD